jgi:hypothetical protein
MRSSLRCIVLAAALGCAAIAGAQAASLADTAAAIDHVLTEREGYRVVVGHISRVLGITVDTLRDQQRQSGLSWGQMLVAHRLSREAKTTVSFEQVAVDFRSGKSWEDIARAYGVDLAPLVTTLQRSQAAVEQRSEDRAPPPIVGTPSAVPPGGGVLAPSGRKSGY